MSRMERQVIVGAPLFSERRYYMYEYATNVNHQLVSPSAMDGPLFSISLQAASKVSFYLGTAIKAAVSSCATDRGSQSARCPPTESPNCIHVSRLMSCMLGQGGKSGFGSLPTISATSVQALECSNINAPCCNTNTVESDMAVSAATARTTGEDTLVVNHTELFGLGKPNRIV